jgi:hypothetical protein
MRVCVYSALLLNNNKNKVMLICGERRHEESLKYEKRREEQRTIEHQSLMRHDDALKASSKEANVVFFVLSQTFSYLCVYIINTLVYTILCLLI